MRYIILILTICVIGCQGFEQPSDSEQDICEVSIENTIYYSKPLQTNTLLMHAAPDIDFLLNNRFVAPCSGEYRFTQGIVLEQVEPQSVFIFGFNINDQELTLDLSNYENADFVILLDGIQKPRHYGTTRDLHLNAGDAVAIQFGVASRSTSTFTISRMDFSIRSQ